MVEESTAVTTTTTSSIVLCMIVKNEADVIARCLASVRSLISAWVIVDTGSTDQTREIVRDVLKDIPGEILDRPWKNFGHNRSEALELARGRGDYVLVIDADDTLEMAPDFVRLPPLTLDSYLLRIRYGAVSYDRVQLLRNDKNWRYDGVLHEYPASDTAKTQAKLESITYIINNDGARAKDQDRFRHDAEILEDALAKEPANRRYAFYLGQSYRDAQMHEKSLEAYERRAVMGGWNEEVFNSLLEAAKLRERLKHSFDVVHTAYLHAHESRPQRSEPLYELARYCRNQGRFTLGCLYASAAVQIERPPNDKLFVADSVYSWRAKDELAVCAYHCERYALGRALNEALIASGAPPPADLVRIRDNLNWCLKGLEKTVAADAAPPNTSATVTGPASDCRLRAECTGDPKL